MNRREFIAASIVAAIATTRIDRTHAQDEARWDAASRLFGNARDVIGTADENQGQVLASKANDTNGVYSLVHNNSDRDAIVTAVRTDDPAIQLMPAWIAAPYIWKKQSYALLQTIVPIDTELDLDAPFPAIWMDVMTPDAPGAQVLEHTDLEIGAVAYTDDGKVSVSASSASAISGQRVSGLIVWFEDDGTPIDGLALSTSGELLDGTEFAVESYLPWRDADIDLSQSRYLVGLTAYVQ